MRLSTLPLFIDEFPTLRSREWRSAAAATINVFILSHFHTDHMKGLHSGWATGIIVTSTITKQLLLSKFDGLRGRVLGLPYWCRTPLLCAAEEQEIQRRGVASAASSEPTVEVAAAASSIVYVTLLPAFHIPGSAMVYLELPSGVTYLHTGDFKFMEAARRSPLVKFLQTHRVDHLYLDDTWLHLGHMEVTRWPPCAVRSSADEARNNTSDGLERCCDDLHGRSAEASGVRVLSKLLSAEQVEEAIEAIGRRMDHQRRLFALWQQQQQEEGEVEGHDTAKPPAMHARQPFVVRVYLHNQFGKEMVIQRLAERLRTRAVIDDVRYARLLTVVEALEEEKDDLRDFSGVVATSSPSPSTASPLSEEERAWRSAGGEAAYHPYNLNHFISSSSASTRLASSSAQEAPLIEVVGTRSGIAPAALQEASDARSGTPYYGVLVSGWARMQASHKDASSAAQVWQVPTTLHCTPQETIDFVALLRPLSVAPLHYRPSRGTVVMQRLGPYLRTPFLNRHAPELENGASALAQRDMRRSRPPSCWTLCLPTSILCQDGIITAEAGARVTMGTSVEAISPTYQNRVDAIMERPRRGYRIRPPSSADGCGSPNIHTGAAQSSSPSDSTLNQHWAASLSSTIAAQHGENVPSDERNDAAARDEPTEDDYTGQEQLLSSWRLRTLTQTYVNALESGRKRERVERAAEWVAGASGVPVPSDGIVKAQSVSAVHEAKENATQITPASDGVGWFVTNTTSQRSCPSLSDIADQVL